MNVQTLHAGLCMHTCNASVTDWIERKKQSLLQFGVNVFYSQQAAQQMLSVQIK